MCSDSNIDFKSLLLQLFITAIKKEIDMLREMYFNSLADYNFMKIVDTHEQEAEELETLEEKLEVYKRMYFKALEFLYEAQQEQEDPYFFEGEEQVDYQEQEKIDSDNGKLPF